MPHHGNRFHHSPSMLTNQTSVLSLNQISRDHGFDPFRGSTFHVNHHHRHSYVANGELRNGAKGLEGSEDDDDMDEEEEEEEEGNETVEDPEETSTSDSTQEDRGTGGNGPRVSFISTSETRLNDISYHDKNCAKAKALNAQIQSVKGLPSI